MKHRNGYVYREGNSWVARVDFTDESGKRRVARRYCETKTEANRKRQELVRSIEERGEKAVDGDKLTFKTLAEKYKEARLIPAEYVNQRKVADVRSLASALYTLNVLVEYFGDRKVRSVTHADLESYKRARLKIPTVRGSERSITSVNRSVQHQNRPRPRRRHDIAVGIGVETALRECAQRPGRSCIWNQGQFQKRVCCHLQSGRD